MPPQLGQRYKNGVITSVSPMPGGGYRIQYSVSGGAPQTDIYNPAIATNPSATQGAMPPVPALTPNYQAQFGPEGRAPTQEPPIFGPPESLATPPPPSDSRPSGDDPTAGRAAQTRAGIAPPRQASTPPAARTGPPPAAASSSASTTRGGVSSPPTPSAAAPTPPPFNPGPLVVRWNPETNQYDQQQGNDWVPTSYTIEALNGMVAQGRNVQEDRYLADWFDALPLDQQNQYRDSWTWHNGRLSNPAGQQAQQPTNPDGIVSTAAPSTGQGEIPAMLNVLGTRDAVRNVGTADNPWYIPYNDPNPSPAEMEARGLAMLNSRGTRDAESFSAPASSAANTASQGVHTPPSVPFGDNPAVTKTAPETPMGQEAWNAAMGFNAGDMELDEYGQWRKKKQQMGGGMGMASPQPPGEGPITQNMAAGGRVGPPPDMPADPNVIVGEGLESDPMEDNAGDNAYNMELIFIIRPDGTKDWYWSEGPTSMQLPAGDSGVIPIKETGPVVKMIKEMFPKAPGEPLNVRLDGSYQGKQSGQVLRTGGRVKGKAAGGRVGPPPAPGRYGEVGFWQGVGQPTFGNSNALIQWSKPQQDRYTLGQQLDGDFGGFDAYQQRLQGLAPTQMGGSQSVYEG